jgi:hypothetical protein
LKKGVWLGLNDSFWLYLENGVLLGLDDDFRLGLSKAFDWAGNMSTGLS